MPDATYSPSLLDAYNGSLYIHCSIFGKHKLSHYGRGQYRGEGSGVQATSKRDPVEFQHDSLTKQITLMEGRSKYNSCLRSSISRVLRRGLKGEPRRKATTLHFAIPHEKGS